MLTLKERGRLILISSHVQEDIETICDKVYLLSNGDFTATFDLKNQQEVLTYTVSVTDVQVLENFLTRAGVQVEIKENTIKFDSSPEDFQIAFRHAVEEGVYFDSIKKESKFAEFIKKGSN